MHPMLADRTKPESGVLRTTHAAACAFAAMLLAVGCGAAHGQTRPATAELLDHLCAKTLRANEEDRLYGTISVTVRATIKYEGGSYSPDLVDDAVQNAVEALTQNCPRFAATDDAHRLGIAIAVVRDETLKLLRVDPTFYPTGEMDKATAADLSQELSSREIDSWLDGLSPRQRALALFLYASGVTDDQVGAAVGAPPGQVSREIGDTKTSLLKFFREESDGGTGGPGAGPSMEYREVGLPFLALLMPGRGESVVVTGISPDIYGGWSLLATVRGLWPGQSVDIREPFLLVPDAAGRKRMIVTDLQEIPQQRDGARRFLLKAFAIDGEGQAPGVGDALRLGAPNIANPEALRTLANNNLSYIEKTRCLWRDYGTGDDPGLCR